MWPPARQRGAIYRHRRRRLPHRRRRRLRRQQRHLSVSERCKDLRPSRPPRRRCCPSTPRRRHRRRSTTTSWQGIICHLVEGGHLHRRASAHRHVRPSHQVPPVRRTPSRCRQLERGTTRHLPRCTCRLRRHPPTILPPHLPQRLRHLRSTTANRHRAVIIPPSSPPQRPPLLGHHLLDCNHEKQQARSPAALLRLRTPAAVETQQRRRHY